MAEFIVIIRRNLVLQTYTVTHVDTLIEAISHSMRELTIKQIKQIEEIRAISVVDMIEVDVKRVVENAFKFDRESLRSLHESN